MFECSSHRCIRERHGQGVTAREKARSPNIFDRDLRQPFGRFKIQSSRETDQKLIDQHIPQARANALTPNHYWFRMVAEQNGAIIGKKEYHLDLERNIVEVTETWDGAETAFDIIRLPAMN